MFNDLDWNACSIMSALSLNVSRVTLSYQIRLSLGLTVVILTNYVYVIFTSSCILVILMAR